MKNLVVLFALLAMSALSVPVQGLPVQGERRNVTTYVSNESPEPVSVIISHMGTNFYQLIDPYKSACDEYFCGYSLIVDLVSITLWSHEGIKENHAHVNVACGASIVLVGSEAFVEIYLSSAGNITEPTGNPIGTLIGAIG